jgi:hypothetical protein
MRVMVVTPPLLPFLVTQILSINLSSKMVFKCATSLPPPRASLVVKAPIQTDLSQNVLLVSNAVLAQGSQRPSLTVSPVKIKLLQSGKLSLETMRLKATQKLQSSY